MLDLKKTGVMIVCLLVVGLLSGCDFADSGTYSLTIEVDYIVAGGIPDLRIQVGNKTYDDFSPPEDGLLVVNVAGLEGTESIQIAHSELEFEPGEIVVDESYANETFNF